MSEASLGSRIAFVGLGAMGEPMAKVLQAAGFELMLFDIRSEVSERIASENNMRAARNATELAQWGNVVITMLPTSAHVQEALLNAKSGEAPLANSLAAGSLVIDMTSGQPARTRDIGAQLAKSDIDLVDAPVSGSVTRAVKGDLTVMLGGDTLAKAKAQAYLKPMARTVYDTGALGTGQAMKALNNMTSAAGFWIVSEALSVGKKLGLEPATMIDVLNASTGMNNSTQNKFKQYVLSQNYGGNFLLSLMAKDLSIAKELAEQQDAYAPLMTLTENLWRESFAELGSQADHTAVAGLVAKRSQTDLAS